MLFALFFVFPSSIEEHPSLQTVGNSQNTLLSAFAEKKILLKSLLDRTNSEELSDLLGEWEEVSKYYHATNRQKSSKTNSLECFGKTKDEEYRRVESAQYELFCALCFLKKEQRKEFIEKFKFFYNKIRKNTQMSVSASFLMLCSAIERDQDKIYKYIKTKFNNSNITSLCFWVGFPFANTQDFLENPTNQEFPPHFREVFPNSTDFIKMETEEDRDTFLAVHLQTLAVAANSTQPDPSE